MLYTPFTDTELAFAFAASVSWNVLVMVFIPSTFTRVRVTGEFKGRFAAMLVTSITPLAGLAVPVPAETFTLSPPTLFVTSSPNWFVILYSIVPPAAFVSPFNTRYLLGTSILESLAVSPLKEDVFPPNSTV